MTDPEYEKCGRPYTLTHGDEPTPYCDACAHLLVEELEREASEAKAVHAKHMVALVKDRDQLRAEVEKLKGGK